MTGIGAAAPTFVITGDSRESIEAALVGPIHSSLVGNGCYAAERLAERGPEVLCRQYECESGGGYCVP